jgi:hypothetical protein
LASWLGGGGHRGNLSSFPVQAEHGRRAHYNSVAISIIARAIIVIVIIIIIILMIIAGAEPWLQFVVVAVVGAAGAACWRALQTGAWG